MCVFCWVLCGETGRRHPRLDLRSLGNFCCWSLLPRLRSFFLNTLTLPCMFMSSRSGEPPHWKCFPQRPDQTWYERKKLSAHGGSLQGYPYTLVFRHSSVPGNRPAAGVPRRTALTLFPRSTVPRRPQQDWLTSVGGSTQGGRSSQPNVGLGSVSGGGSHGLETQRLPRRAFCTAVSHPL